MRLTIFSLLILALAACSEHRHETSMQMDLAESLMESRPDSALSILSDITASELSGKKERARHALLMSMALDKNYIDTATFDVLQPAIDHYLKKGSPDEKIRTYYYKGRICQNAGDEDNAMAAFVNAIDLEPEVTDSLTLARALVTQAMIFSSVHNTDKKISNLIKASNIFKGLGREDEAIVCKKRAFNTTITYELFPLADSLYTELKHILIDRPDLYNNLYSNLIQYQITKEASKADVNSCLHGWEHFDLTDNDMIVIAQAYDYIGDYKTANRILDELDINVENKAYLKFLATCVDLYYHEGKIEEAFETYCNFNAISDSIDYALFRKDIQSSERVYQQELTNLKLQKQHNKRTYCLIITLIIISSVTLILALLYKQQKLSKKVLENDNETLKNNLSEIEVERNGLKEMLKSTTSISEESKRIVKERLAMLNSILIDEMLQPDNIDAKTKKRIKKAVEDKDRFIKENRNAVEATYPALISHLNECGLCDAEINYACLYAIGLKGVNISSILNSNTHYNMSTSVRKKLGLNKNDSNLSIYIRNLMNGVK